MSESVREFAVRWSTTSRGMIAKLASAYLHAVKERDDLKRDLDNALSVWRDGAHMLSHIGDAQREYWVAKCRRLGLAYKRLRLGKPGRKNMRDYWSRFYREQRERADRAEARLATVEKALRPFAILADKLPAVVPGYERLTDDDGVAYQAGPGPNEARITFGDFRRARAALGEGGEGR